MKGLELQRVTGRIEEKESRLFAGKIFEANVRLDDERYFPLRQTIGKFSPLFHGKNCSEMTHRHLIAIDIIMCFVSGLIRA